MLRRLPLALLIAAPGLILLVGVALTDPVVRVSFAFDLDIYRRYGVAVLGGAVPYRDVPLEYPPLALVPMVLPLLLPPDAIVDGQAYLWRFVAMQAVLAMALAWLIWVAGGRSRVRLGVWTIAIGVSWVAAALRYDLWPAGLVLVALLVVDRRPGLAGAVLGAAVMVKLFPAVVLAALTVRALALGDRRGVVRMVVAAIAVVLGVAIVPWLAAGPASLDWLRYQELRGLQVESLGASILLGLHLAGYPVAVDFGYGSVQVSGPGSDWLVLASPLAVTILVGGVLLLTWRRFRAASAAVGTGEVWLIAAAAITGLLVGSKVLSMQYPLWLAALAPFLAGRSRWLVLASAALSTWIFTAIYLGLWRLDPIPSVALLIRNGLLIWLLGVLLRELADRVDTGVASVRTVLPGGDGGDGRGSGARGRVDGGSGDAPLSLPEPPETPQVPERAP